MNTVENDSVKVSDIEYYHEENEELDISLLSTKVTSITF